LTVDNSGVKRSRRVAKMREDVSVGVVCCYDDDDRQRRPTAMKRKKDVFGDIFVLCILVKPPATGSIASAPAATGHSHGH
jgi:hypothetical protein